MKRLSTTFVLVSCVSVYGDEWLRFRGENGAGVTDKAPLPNEIAPDKNVLWKTTIPMGKSSPVVTADRIYLTGHQNGKLLTFALDRKSGKLLWTRDAPGHRGEKRHQLNDPAAPSPASDGTNVYVFFAGYGLVSYDANGQERWKLALGPFRNFHGMGASPIVADNKVIMICDQDQNAFLLAVEKDTGKTVWKVERPEMVHSFSTPIIYRSPEGKSEIIIPGSYQMTSYDLATGSLIWRVRGLTYQVKSGPVLDGDRLYFNGWAPGGEPSERLELPSFEVAVKEHDRNGDGKLAKDELPRNWLPGNWEMQDLDKDGLWNAKDWQYYSFRRTSTNSAMAIQLGGRGDVTNSHVLWRYDRSLPDVPGILLYRGVLYLIRNGGILQTLDPKTGKLLKQGRLTHALDEYYTSPVAGDGKIYVISRTGTVSILKAGAEWEVISFAELGEEVFATPAIADGHIWVRTASALYAFAPPQQSASILEQIRAHREGLAVWWVGNAGWLIKSNNVLIATDLDLSTQNKVQPPVITPEELSSELDLAFVSHHHGDHCNLPTIRALAAGPRTTLVLPQTCLKRLSQTAIPKERLIVPEPGRAFEAKAVRVEPIHAIHGNQEFTVLTREPDFIDSIRQNCGYVLNISGKRFFHPGDSVLTEEHLALKNIDVLFVSPTVHNMYVDRSAILINRLQPAYIFPQHFGTFRQTPENEFWTRGYPDELRNKLSGDLQQRYHKLAQGEKFVIR